MKTRATTLSHRDTGRVLWGLTRPDRVTHLERVAEKHPNGAVLATPLGRMLITSNPSATKHVLVTNAANYEKGIGQSQARRIVGDGLLTAEGPGWRAQRDAATPFLRARAVETKQPAIATLAHASVAKLANEGWHSAGSGVDLAAYTLGCLATTFGFRVPDAVRIHHAFEAVQDEALSRSVTRGLIPTWLRPIQQTHVQRALRDLAAETHTALNDQLRDEPWATEEGMTSLFLAGYETTASTLAWTILHLARNPTVQDRLFQEATREFPSASHETTWIAPNLPYAEAVFKETLRTRPPVWLISRKALKPDVIDGIRLRAGDEVLILPSAVARRAWDDPDDYRPERFMGTSQRHGLWFGAGPRACPGGALASTEGIYWLAAASSQIRLRLKPGVRATPLARMSQTPAQDLSDLVTLEPRIAPGEES